MYPFLNYTTIALCSMILITNNTYALSHHSRHQQIQNIKQNTYFTYDTPGNILTKTIDKQKTIYVYNAINQLTHIQWPTGTKITFKYDTLGNAKQDSKRNQYRYNFLGQLAQFTNLQTGTKIRYQYYANGLRSKKTSTPIPIVAKAINYYYDSSENNYIVNEKQGQTTTSYLLPHSHMIRYIENNETPLIKQITIAGSKDVNVLLDDQGKIKKTYHYSPNGMTQPIIFQPILTTQPQPRIKKIDIQQNPFQYSNEYHDQESNLYYLRARYYDPNTQHFIQRDSYPLMNRYNYANNNPVTKADPSGHMSVTKILNVISGSLALTEMGLELSFTPGLVSTRNAIYALTIAEMAIDISSMVTTNKKASKTLSIIAILVSVFSLGLQLKFIQSGNRSWIFKRGSEAQKGNTRNSKKISFEYKEETRKKEDTAYRRALKKEQDKQKQRIDKENQLRQDQFIAQQDEFVSRNGMHRKRKLLKESIDEGFEKNLEPNSPQDIIYHQLVNKRHKSIPCTLLTDSSWRFIEVET